MPTNIPSEVAARKWKIAGMVERLINYSIKDAYPAP
jgi:hypothetical protein